MGPENYVACIRRKSEDNINEKARPLVATVRDRYPLMYKYGGYMYIRSSQKLTHHAQRS